MEKVHQFDAWTTTLNSPSNVSIIPQIDVTIFSITIENAKKVNLFWFGFQFTSQTRRRFETSNYKKRHFGRFQSEKNQA